MAIKGLTDRRAMFPELGVLRKGGPKTDPKKPGPDLDYFRFDTDDEEARAVFLEAFGDKPREIEIVLPFATVDDNFEAWREEYVASGLKHRCDGQTCVQWLDKSGIYRFDAIPCPTPTAEQRKNGGCKQTARLKVIIPALERFAYVTVTTTSVWDIMTLHQNLSALELLRGNLRGIPMILCRREREVSTPSNDGKRARRKKWLLCVEAKPDWVRLELAAQQRAALPQVDALTLSAWEPEDEEDEAREDVAPEMITDAQLEQANSVIKQLRQFGVTNEQLAEGISNLTNGRADNTAELTNADAANVINAFSQRLKEKAAEAERTKTAAK